MTPGRCLILLAGLIFIAIGIWRALEQVSFVELASAREVELRDWYQHSPVTAATSIFFAYALVLSFPIPGSQPATLFCGWMLGFSVGILLVSFASTFAASIPFCFCRACFNRSSQSHFSAFGRKWQNLPQNEALSLLFLLRLTPGIPFFAINTGFAFSTLSLRQYWIVSQLGMLPATAVYVYLGSQLPSLAEFSKNGIASLMSRELIAGFTLLGSLPLVTHILVRRFRQRPDETSLPTEVRADSGPAEAD